jgi:hypothetical protein
LGIFVNSGMQSLSMTAPTVAIYLDMRREKVSGKYPVKLKVYFNDETVFYKKESI